MHKKRWRPGNGDILANRKKVTPERDDGLALVMRNGRLVWPGRFRRIKVDNKYKGRGMYVEQE